MLFHSISPPHRGRVSEPNPHVRLRSFETTFESGKANILLNRDVSLAPHRLVTLKPVTERLVEPLYENCATATSRPEFIQIGAEFFERFLKVKESGRKCFLENNVA